MKARFQTALVLLLVAAILGLVEMQFHFLRNLSGGPPLAQRELAMQFLGQYLADHWAGKKAVVLSNPFTQQRGQPPEIYRFEKAGLRGLQRGLGNKVMLEAVVFPELRPEFSRNPAAVFIDPGTTTPLSYLVAENALDSVVKQHPGADLIISLIGLPINILQTEAWRLTSPIKFGLLLPDLRMLGGAAAIRLAIKSEKIAAIVIHKPGSPAEDQPLGKDAALEFDRRFLLVTAGNIDQYLKQYPKLFGVP